MKISLVCIGRLGASPEGKLCADYAARATSTGRSFGLGPVEIVELESRKSGKTAEAEVLIPRLQETHLIACDEHGAAQTSREFAAKLAKLRDDGVRHVSFVIGGADGLDRQVLALARETLAFGPQTWPHALARVMLAEQIYRAAAIAGGTPYHRD